MAKKIIKLTENDVHRIIMNTVNRIIKESNGDDTDWIDDEPIPNHYTVDDIFDYPNEDLRMSSQDRYGDGISDEDDLHSFTPHNSEDDYMGDENDGFMDEYEEDADDDFGTLGYDDPDDYIHDDMDESKKYIKNIVSENINKYINEGGQSPIHIKKKNEGKFNALKKRTGKSTEELTHSKNPLTRKRAVFAQNAKRWNHKKSINESSLGFNFFVADEGDGMLNIFSTDDFDKDGYLNGYHGEDGYNIKDFDIVKKFVTFRAAEKFVDKYNTDEY